MTEPDPPIDVSVTLTARVPSRDAKGGYDLTHTDGDVTIAKYGASNKTPTIALEDLERAVKALKGGNR